jgi:hypothetical protein
MVYRETILPFKLAIDLRYAERHSVLGDLLLLARTVLLPGVRIWRRLSAAFARDGAVLWSRVASAAGLAMMVVLLAGLLAAEARAPV